MGGRTRADNERARAVLRAFEGKQERIWREAWEQATRERREAITRELMALAGIGRATARSVMTRGVAATLAAADAKNAAKRSERRERPDAWRLADDGTIMTARERPEGCSEARWRIELERRRRRRAGIRCGYDPDRTYAVRF